MPVSATPVRIAWLFPTLRRSFYFQPVFREMARLFPGSAIFTGLWPGYLDGYEGTFEVRDLQGARLVDYAKGTDEGYGGVFIWVPPSAIWTLFRFRPRVIIVGGFSIALVYAVLLKWLTRCRIVILWDGNAPYASFERRTLRGRIRRVLGWFLDAGVSNTVDGARYLHEAIGIPAGQCSTSIYQVPDVPALTTRTPDTASMASATRPLFLFVGRLVPSKGLHHLLQASAFLVAEGLDGFSLAVVGSGPEEASLRALADTLGVADRVQWLGERPYGEMGGFFEACDVFVMPSLLELRGMVVSEAMCFGKPVIVTRNADLAEIVHHGENGFTYDPHNPRELADLMARFIREPELRVRCGERSAAIIAPHTATAAAAHIARVIHEACGTEAVA